MNNTTAQNRIFSVRTGPDWQELNEDGDLQSARQECLSDVLLSPNLVVLTDLGTSCYMKVGGKRLAPTMADLRAEVSKDADFKSILKKTGFPAAEQNIEKFLRSSPAGLIRTSRSGVPLGATPLVPSSVQETALEHTVRPGSTWLDLDYGEMIGNVTARVPENHAGARYDLHSISPLSRRSALLRE